jgi:hypothetical protein
MVSQKPTTLGDLTGLRTERLSLLAGAFRARDMDAWLKAHAFFVTAISGAIYLAGRPKKKCAVGWKSDLTARGAGLKVDLRLN